MQKDDVVMHTHTHTHTHTDTHTHKHTQFKQKRLMGYFKAKSFILIISFDLLYLFDSSQDDKTLKSAQ